MNYVVNDHYFIFFFQLSSPICYDLKYIFEETCFETFHRYPFQNGWLSRLVGIPSDNATKIKGYFAKAKHIHKCLLSNLKVFDITKNKMFPWWHKVLFAVVESIKIQVVILVLFNIVEQKLHIFEEKKLRSFTLVKNVHCFSKNYYYTWPACIPVDGCASTF